MDERAQSISELITQLRDLMLDHRSLLDTLPTVRHPLHTAKTEAEMMYNRLNIKGE